MFSAARVVQPLILVISDRYLHTSNMQLLIMCSSWSLVDGDPVTSLCWLEAMLSSARYTPSRPGAPEEEDYLCICPVTS